MQNYFLIETETEHRRSEMERAVEAAARAALAHPENGRIRWAHLPRLVLTGLRSRSASLLPLTFAGNTATAERRSSKTVAWRVLLREDASG